MDGLLWVESICGFGGFPPWDKFGPPGKAPRGRARGLTYLCSNLWAKVKLELEFVFVVEVEALSGLGLLVLGGGFVKGQKSGS